VAFHGRPRATGDIDCFVERSPANAAAVVRAIEHFGFGCLGLKAEDLLEPDIFVQIGREPSRIDLTNEIPGVTFEEVWRDRVPAVVEGVPVHFISKELLIRNKAATGRPKDIADLDRLR
jgi:hypothetical protein